MKDLENWINYTRNEINKKTPETISYEEQILFYIMNQLAISNKIKLKQLELQYLNKNKNIDTLSSTIEIT